jgi:hypothetical protein
MQNKHNQSTRKLNLLLQTRYTIANSSVNRHAAAIMQNSHTDCSSSALNPFSINARLYSLSQLVASVQHSDKQARFKSDHMKCSKCLSCGCVLVLATSALRASLRATRSYCMHATLDVMHKWQISTMYRLGCQRLWLIGGSDIVPLHPPPCNQTESGSQ